MTDFQIIVNNQIIKYVHPLSEQGKGAILLENTIPEENETFGNLTKDEYQAQLYKLNNLSTRNDKSVFQVPIEKEVVYLNFVPEKTIVSDSNINYINSNEFRYFTIIDETESFPLPFSLEEGAIFRVTGEGIKEATSYQYYIIQNNVVQTIPNSQTLEVLLGERELTYQAIRIISQLEFNELVQSLGIE